MKPLPAFTLVEVLLSMLLVVLLGTFATIVLGGSLSDLGDQVRIAGQEQELLWLCQGVQADVDRSSRIHVDAEGMVIFMIDGKEVHYHVNDGHVSRTSVGEERNSPVPVLASTYVLSEDAPSLVCAWTLTVGAKELPQRLTFRKVYDLQTIMRFRSSDEHTIAPGR
jgi:type II secretory pathway pseudopilin PulG